MLGLAVGGILIPLALYALWILANKIPWTAPVAAIPGLVLALTLPVWTAFHLAQWIQERPKALWILALGWVILAVWTEWNLPEADTPLFGRFYILVPILAMALGMVPPASTAMQEKFAKKERRPFRWGLWAGLITAGFAVGMESFVPETPSRLVSWMMQAGLELAQAIFVALVMTRLLRRRWPVLALAGFAAVGLFTLAMIAQHRPKLRRYRGVQWHALYPIGVCAGVGLDAWMKRKKAGCQNATDAGECR
jgi:hypothetical protein